MTKENIEPVRVLPRRTSKNDVDGLCVGETVEIVAYEQTVTCRVTETHDN